MATTMSTASVTTDITGIIDSCLPLKVFVVNSFWDVDKLSVGLAFLVGLIVGLLITLFCARLCMRDMSRNKGVERYHILEDGGRLEQKSSMLQQSYSGTSSVKRRSTKKKTKMMDRLKQRLTSSPVEEPLAAVALISIEPRCSGGVDDGRATERDGVLEALLQTSLVDTEEEIGRQDIVALEELDSDLKEESIMTMLQMMRTLLGQQLAGGTLSREELVALVKGTQTGAEGAVNDAQRTRDSALEALNSRKFKDPSEKDSEIERIQSSYRQKLTMILPDECNKLRRELSSKTKMTDSEIDALLGELSENMAALETSLTTERMRQAQVLEDRLMRRRLAVDSQAAEKTTKSSELSLRCEATQQLLASFENNLLERQRNELLDTYRDDVRRAEMKINEEIERQQLVAAEKLRRRREVKTRKLAEQEEREKEEFLQSADTLPEVTAVMKAYGQLLRSQQEKRNQLNDDLDEREIKQFADIAAEQQSVLDAEVGKREEALHAVIRSQAQLSDSEARRMMDLHQQQTHNIHKMMKVQRHEQRSRIEEKIIQRRQVVADEQQTLIVEQQTLKESQDSMVEKVIKSQMDLTDDAKKQILREHEHNMSAVSNQLQMSKLRQQKILQQKLNKRQAKLADLKMKVEDVKLSGTEIKSKERAKLQQQLETQIAAEEKRLSAATEKAEAEFRQQVALETEAALSEQEKQMGLLLARLQVGQARRQAIIQKQDKTIQELEEQLTSRVSADPNSQSDAQINTILKHHYDQMNNLNDQLSDTKQRQQQMFAEKLNVKKLTKQREIEEELEVEAQIQWKEQKQRGAGLATSILSQTILEQRHQMALRELEHDMQSEMQRQREELNRELEAELEHELTKQKKTFLAHLAAISHMTKGELDELVGFAVEDTGGNRQEAKKLAKELTTEMTRAKTELQLVDPNLNWDENEGENQRRPKSSKRRQSRPASSYQADGTQF